jgi:SAM-dependent methyltransferase
MESLQQLTRKYLEWAPMSLTIREVTRINALRILDRSSNIFSAQRILDVGCGDGRWWTHIIPQGLDKVYGVDISSREISLAQSFISAQCLDITADDFIDKISCKKFDLIIGNCSLEHVYHIDKALLNIHQVLDEDGKFIMLVPTPFWALKGRSSKLMHKISPRLSMSFSGFLNGFFQHWHLYNHNVWKSVLTDLGFKVTDLYGLGNGPSEFLFRLGLPTSFISFLVKCLTGKYLNYFLSALIPEFIKKKIASQICFNVDEFLPNPDASEIFEYMIVCEKK